MRPYAHLPRRHHALVAIDRGAMVFGLPLLAPWNCVSDGLVRMLSAALK